MTALSSLLGTHLTLWLGVSPTVSMTAPLPVMEALQTVEVNQSDEGIDGFRIVFNVGRPGIFSIDYALLSLPQLRPNNRVIIQVRNGLIPQVLIDGFITNLSLDPGHGPGTGTLTVTGEDTRYLMSLRTTNLPMVGTFAARVQQLLLGYAAFFGSAPITIPELSVEGDSPTSSIPAQIGNDLEYVQLLASRAGYTFFIEPTPVPMVVVPYWGPRPVINDGQPSLKVNLSGETNVSNIRFEYNSIGPVRVMGAVTEKLTGVTVPIAALVPTRPPLTPIPPIVLQNAFMRTVPVEDAEGLNPARVLARAQATVTRFSDAVSATGELDTSRYGASLRPRRLVGVRGAGFLNDGLYYVSRVTHELSKGSYKQRFTLCRDGLGSIVPALPL